MKIDLHVHSKYSPDSNTEPLILLKTCLKKGLGGIAVTDHNTIKGGLSVKQLVRKNKFPLITVVGAEKMTERGEVIGLFLNEELKSNKFEEVSDEIREQGGLVVAPHPFDFFRIRTSLRPKKKDVPFLDAIETINSRCLFDYFNKKAALFAETNILGSVGGSDAHFPQELGMTFTEFNGSSEEELRKNILNRKTNVFGKHSSFKLFFDTFLLKRFNLVHNRK